MCDPPTERRIGRTYRLTGGHTLLRRCENASENVCSKFRRVCNLYLDLGTSHGALSACLLTSLWSRITKNPDWNTGPLACSFARTTLFAHSRSWDSEWLNGYLFCVFFYSGPKRNAAASCFIPFLFCYFPMEADTRKKEGQRKKKAKNNTKNRVPERR